MLASDLILMLALIAETSWLYSRMALLIAARDRERDAKLMSMDAVTAAISHEVGQPLTAASLNASAALRWLTPARPNIERAIVSLRAVSDATQRTFDVIRSIRTTFSRGSVEKTEFSLNSLVTETASLLDRELAASKVSLHLSLDESLPLIRADRVQMQRVLVNLFTNAIEFSPWDTERGATNCDTFGDLGRQRRAAPSQRHWHGHRARRPRTYL